MGHHHTQINLTSQKVSKATVVEIWKQPTKTEVTKSHNVIIITIRVEIVVTLSTNLIKCGILIGSTIILDSGSSGVSTRRNLSRSFALSITTIRVVRTPQIMFTNLIITTHVNKITDRPPMNSMATRRCKNADATNPRKGYQEPSIITAQILDHKDGHSVRPNRVALKYLDFKKDVDQMFMLECLIL